MGRTWRARRERGQEESMSMVKSTSKKDLVGVVGRQSRKQQSQSLLFKDAEVNSSSSSSCQGEGESLPQGQEKCRDRR